MIYIKEVQEYIDYVEKNPLETDEEIKLLIENIVKPTLSRDDVFFNEKQYYQAISFCEKWFYELFPYQKFIYAFFFFYDKEDLSICTFHEIFLMMARGNGKDGMIMPLATYFLTPGYGVPKYNIEIVANAEQQAHDSFDIVYNMLEDNKKVMKKHFYWTKEVIIHRKTKSRMRYNTSNAKTKDGKNIGMIIFNELHAYEDEEDINVFTSALGKVDNARIVTITTNGYVREGPLDEKIDLSDAVLHGEYNFTRIAPIIYKIEKKELIDIPMQKFLETTNKQDIDFTYWIQANPSLPFRSTLRNEIVQDYFNYLKKPSYVSEFYTKRFNIPEQNTETVTVEWKNIERASYSDVKKKIPRNNEIPEGSSVVVGIDFADLNDFVSAGILYKRENGEVIWQCHTWVCKKGRDFKSIKNFPLQKMLGQPGYQDYEIVDTNTISIDLIVNWVLEQMQFFNILKIVIDNFRAGLVRTKFEAVGITIEDKEHKNGLIRTIRYPASIAAIVAPKIDVLFSEGLIIIGNSAIMRWAINNTATKLQKDGNKRYEKINPKTRKNDPFMAYVAAMSQIDLLEIVYQGETLNSFSI